MPQFFPKALPVLIGSLPHSDHLEAADLIFQHTPDIPLWSQLPKNKAEGMLLQFLPGLPGVTEKNDKIYINLEDPGFEEEFLSFFEDYLMISEGGAALDGSRFAMSADEAGGFFTFLTRARTHQSQLVALKGQLTGPITFCTGLVDQDGRALFYNEQMRDAALKLLALKARWQTKKMAEIKGSPLIFFDEPGLAGFGSSAFITITEDDIKACFTEVCQAVHDEGGLAGVHVCANTEWSILFDSPVDVISFDAYSYFDKLILYPQQLVSFFARAGILASGIIPTASEYIDSETAETLAEKWFEQSAQIEKLGVSAKTIFEQTLITPSCGTGTISEAEALRVLELTRDVSAIIRSKSR
jgi:methionine synthase II (cobalamin-independent)